jgi:hypothetical protein
MELMYVYLPWKNFCDNLGDIKAKMGISSEVRSQKFVKCGVQTARAGPPAHLLTDIQGLQVYQLSDIR